MSEAPVVCGTHPPLGRWDCWRIAKERLQNAQSATANYEDPLADNNLDYVQEMLREAADWIEAIPRKKKR